MRVFLDANVLFSASNRGSNIAALVDALVAGTIAVTSDLACAEARRILALKRADWLPAFEELLLRIEQVPSARFELPANPRREGPAAPMCGVFASVARTSPLATGGTSAICSM